MKEFIEVIRLYLNKLKKKMVEDTDIDVKETKLIKDLDFDVN